MNIQKMSLPALLLVMASNSAFGQYRAWWHFDEASGQAVLDQTGVNNGVLGVTGAAEASDPTRTASGKFNAALSFSSDLVTVPDNASLELNGASFTIESWIYPTAAPSEFGPIVSKWNDIGVNNRGYFVTLRSDRRVRFDISHTGFYGTGPCSIVALPSFACAGSSQLVSSTAVPLNAWSHVVAVFDASTRLMEIYINGVLRGSITAQSATIFESAEPLIIGAGDLGSNVRDFFTGTIDEPRIWNMALNGAYVSDLYAIQTLTYSKAISGPANIPIGAPVTTQRAFIITIANFSGAAVDTTGFSIWDVVPAEFDLNGAPQVAGPCTVNATQPPGAQQGPAGSKKQPELLNILVNGNVLPNGASCAITVNVQTDENPASAKGNKSTQFSPTACPIGGVKLNEGIRVFETGLLPEPFVVIGPVSPLFLSCAI